MNDLSKCIITAFIAVLFGLSLGVGIEHQRTAKDVLAAHAIDAYVSSTMGNAQQAFGNQSGMYLMGTCVTFRPANLTSNVGDQTVCADKPLWVQLR